jgi:glutamate synthase (NADPH/NADH) small chain
MLRFVDTEQEYPAQRAAAERIRDFKEIYAPFGPHGSAEQAERCSQCGIPYCQIHCPLQNNIPDWLRLTAEGRVREAYEVSSATNTFPEICGRICPQDRLCEGNCVIEKGFGSVTIGAVEKYITEQAFAEGWVKPGTPSTETGLSVGIIGAGPAGLAAADMLRRQGHAVHVYDRYDRVGGLMIYGIPNFKLDKEVVQRREALLREAGVQFHLNAAIGEALPFKELQVRHDAVLIATGVYKARGLEIDAGGRSGVIPALDYLIGSNKHGLGDGAPTIDAQGKRVVVIGGGDTAMDCVRTAIRQGAASVTCLYRRDRANMPGSKHEVYRAEEEGVVFNWLSAPLTFEGDAAITGVQVQRMALTSQEAGGRQQAVPIPGDTYQLGADLVITALGFEPEELPSMFNAPALRVSPYGTLAVDAQYQTSMDGVYAAGDIVRGASLVVWAIKDGRDAAKAIHRQLQLQLKKGAA